MAIINKKGIISGVAGNLTFRNFRGKQVVQSKPKRFKQTAASVETSLEFGLCSASAKVMRMAFETVFSGNDGAMVNRFNSLVRNSLFANRYKERGERDLHDADLGFFKGFQFNQNSPFDKVLKVRPTVQLDENFRLKLSIPAFNAKEIQGIKADFFVVRFLAVSFDFKAQCYRYHLVKDIQLKRSELFRGEELDVDLEFPKGRMVLLSLSIHAYTSNGLGEKISLNSSQWSPAELIGGWHIPADEEVEQIRAEGREQSLITSDDVVAYFGRHNFMNKFRSLKEKRRSKEPLVTEVVSGTVDDLPEGDIGFGKS